RKKGRKPRRRICGGSAARLRSSCAADMGYLLRHRPGTMPGLREERSVGLRPLWVKPQKTLEIIGENDRVIMDTVAWGIEQSQATATPAGERLELSNRLLFAGQFSLIGG